LHGPGIDEPLAVEQKAEIYFYHADALGSVSTLTDERQKEVQSYEYTIGVLVVITMLYLLSCSEEAYMNYVPTHAQITKQLPEFITAGAQHIEGLYANMDIDSMLFRYNVETDEQMTIHNVLSEIQSKAEKARWKISGIEPAAIHFQRIEKRGKFFSAEEVRVAIPQTSRVYVAWVQADSRKEISQFQDTSEARYAKRVVWPQLDSYIQRGSAFIK